MAFSCPGDTLEQPSTEGPTDYLEEEILAHHDDGVVWRMIFLTISDVSWETYERFAVWTYRKIT